MIPKKTSTTSIEQKIFLRGYQKLEIGPDEELEVTFKRFSTHNQFKIPLWHINPSPSRLKYMQIGNLAGVIIFGLCSLGTIIGMIESKDLEIALFLVLLLLPFGLFFWLSLLKLQTTSVNAVVFYYRNNNKGIHVWFEKPDANCFNDFCDELKKRAEEAWNNRTIDPAPQSLAGELAALKKLNDSGVLNDAEFERAKAKLIDQTEAKERKIGFAQ